MKEKIDLVKLWIRKAENDLITAENSLKIKPEPPLDIICFHARQCGEKYLKALLDEDDYGLFPVYAFEVEETTRVKSGLDRLLKIPKRFSVRFFIIGPGAKEKDLFNQYINQTPFRDFKDRFQFRLYEELEKLYNSALVHSKEREKFGVVERWGVDYVRY